MHLLHLTLCGDTGLRHERVVYQRKNSWEQRYWASSSGSLMFYLVVLRDKMMFQLVLISSSVGPERAAAGAEKVMGEQTLIQDWRRACRGFPKTKQGSSKIGVYCHLMTGWCCEGRPWKIWDVLRRLHRFGQDKINNDVWSIQCPVNETNKQDTKKNILSKGFLTLLVGIMTPYTVNRT